MVLAKRKIWKMPIDSWTQDELNDDEAFAYDLEIGQRLYYKDDTNTIIPLLKVKITNGKTEII